MPRVSTVLLPAVLWLCILLLSRSLLEAAEVHEFHSTLQKTTIAAQAEPPVSAARQAYNPTHFRVEKLDAELSARAFDDAHHSDHVANVEQISARHDTPNAWRDDYSKTGTQFGIYTHLKPKRNLHQSSLQPTCRTEYGQYGVCYHGDICQFRGGAFNSTCETAGLVCCHFATGCNIATSERITYYRNPSYPANDTGNLICNYQVNAAEDVCAIRLDFLNYSTAVGAGCSDSQLSLLIGHRQRSSPLCGKLQGHSTTVPVKTQDGPLVLSHTLGGVTSYHFNIRVTQIRCASLDGWMEENSPMCGRQNTGQVRHKRRNASRNITWKLDESVGDVSDNLRRLNISRGETGLPWQRFSHNFLQSLVKNITLPNVRSNSAESLWRILGGYVSKVRENTWVVALMKRTADDSLKFFCGGVLIHEEYVLTAAHCVDRIDRYWSGNLLSYIVLSIGDHTLNVVTETDAVYRLARRVIVHHGWDRTTLRHDIALLQLNRPVRLAQGVIVPACLPLPTLPADDRNLTGKTVTLSGWGVTSFNSTPGPVSLQLKSVRLEVVESTQCETVWRAMDNPATVYREFGAIDERKLCVASTPGAACFGDSGGPSSYQMENGRHVVVAITSYGPPVCKIGGPLPAVTTRVSAYLDWIRINTVPLFSER